MNKSLVVTKHNQLIRASYALTLSEQRVLLLCMAKIDSRKPPPVGFEFTISAEDLTRETGVSRTNAYRDLKKAVNTLYERSIFLDINEPMSQIRWLYKKGTVRADGVVSFCFSPDIMPLLSELKERFTTYRLRDVAKFQSSYSLRFYEILIQWRNRNELKADVQWLRDILQLNHKYPRVIDFKKYVVMPAIEDINKFSNMKVTFEQVKRGREITHFLFKYTISGEIETTPKVPKITEELINRHARPGEDRWQVIERLKKMLSDTTNK